LKHGYIFEYEISRSLDLLSKKIDLWFKKLVDTKLFDTSVYCNHCNQRVSHNLIIPKTIADFIYVTHKTVGFLECKSSKQTSFPIRNIEKHQIQYGLQLSYFNVPYYYIICNRAKPKHYTAFAISAQKLDDLIAEILEKRKSIPWRVLEDTAIKLDRLKGGLWNLEPIIGE